MRFFERGVVGEEREGTRDAVLEVFGGTCANLLDPKREGHLPFSVGLKALASNGVKHSSYEEIRATFSDPYTLVKSASPNHSAKELAHYFTSLTLQS